MKHNRRNSITYIALVVAVVLPCAVYFCLHRHYSDKVDAMQNAHFILVDKASMTLSLYDYWGERLMCYPVACGLSLGDKQCSGDMRTPEGIFHVVGVEDAAQWTHDFGDGRGETPGAYGPFFIRLECPGFTGIGIHGTCFPESLGTRATEGCIRLDNDDLRRLVPNVRPGMLVVVLPSADDILAAREQ